MDNRYHISETMLARAEKVIPLGTQTFSKSKTQYPRGSAPFFAQKAKGSKIWDVDGNEYVDFVNGLAAINLGYADDDINLAVKKQIDEGTIFTLPHPLEIEVSEKIVEMVPSAEMVRFGKNGSDVTSAAIRLARAFTGKDRVALCGYHGWQDWYIGTTLRNLGVPKAISSLSHQYSYNDLASLEKLLDSYKGEFAAVIIEPMGPTAPKPGFLEGVKSLAHKHNAVFIMDEMVTGFRCSKGGAQELFNVIPDLSTFGKGIANGFPISALVGRADIMSKMEDIFFSTTFAGETISLAAAKVALNKISSLPVVEHMTTQGKKIISTLNQIISIKKIDHVLSVSGHPTWVFLNFKDHEKYTQWQLKTYFLQEVFKRGILTLGTFNLSFAHSDNDLETLFKVLDEVVDSMQIAISQDNLLSKLNCEVLVPLFRVR